MQQRNMLCFHLMNENKGSLTDFMTAVSSDKVTTVSGCTLIHLL